MSRATRRPSSHSGVSVADSKDSAINERTVVRSENVVKQPRSPRSESQNASRNRLLIVQKCSQNRRGEADVSNAAKAEGSPWVEEAELESRSPFRAFQRSVTPATKTRRHGRLANIALAHAVRTVHRFAQRFCSSTGTVRLRSNDRDSWTHVDLLMEPTGPTALAQQSSI